MLPRSLFAAALLLFIAMPAVNAEDPANSGAPLSPERARELFGTGPSPKAINPGDPGIEPAVYKCALKHLAGVGSDLAARIIWTACLAESGQ